MKFSALNCNLSYDRKDHPSRHQKSMWRWDKVVSIFPLLRDTLISRSPRLSCGPDLILSCYGLDLGELLPIATFEKDRYRAELPANELKLDRRI